MTAPLRILIVEDSADDAEMVVLELSRGGVAPDARRVESAGELRAALADGPWDAVLSDYTMPGFGAAEAFALCRASDPDLPFVVVSGTIGEQRAVEMMRAGAGDYLLKGNLTRLSAAVHREVREADSRRSRRRAEQAIALLASVVESSDDAILSESPGGLVTSWNPGAERLYGWTAAEAVGRHVGFLVTSDRAEEAAGVAARLGRGERVPSFDSVRLHRDGTRVEVSLTASHLQERDGPRIGVATIARDIRERKRGVAAQARHALILANVRDAVVVTDPEGVVTDWNDGATRLFGWTADEILGRHHADRQPEPARAFVTEMLRKLADEGASGWEFEDWRKDGSRVWVEARVSRIADSAGRTAGVMGVYHDVGERRRLEDQLRQSQKLEAVGLLAAGVAHELNNIMTVIGGFSELLLDEQRPACERRDLAQGIHDAGKRATALTAQISAFGGKQILVPCVLDLGAVVRDMGATLRRLIGPDIELVALTSANLGPVKADPAQLDRVIRILAENARDAMPGGGRLTIEAANAGPGARSGRFIVVSVSDTGLGMDESVSARVFEPFFTTKGFGQGTGLGLAVAYGIVAQSGGFVEVSSRPGAGATFRVYLPRIEGPKPASWGVEVGAAPEGIQSIPSRLSSV